MRQKSHLSTSNHLARKNAAELRSYYIVILKFAFCDLQSLLSLHQGEELSSPWWLIFATNVTNASHLGGVSCLSAQRYKIKSRLASFSQNIFIFPLSACFRPPCYIYILSRLYIYSIQSVNSTQSVFSVFYLLYFLSSILYLFYFLSSLSNLSFLSFLSPLPFLIVDINQYSAYFSH